MLHPCGQCRRHVNDHETRCPFCDAPLEHRASSRPLLDGRLSRAAVFASAVLVTPACVVQDPQPRYIQQQPPPPPPPDNRPPDPPPPPPDYAQPPPGDPPAAQTTIRGVITNANTGARYAGIRVDLQGGARPQSTVTNPRGEYVFSNVAPGNYNLRVAVATHPRFGGGDNMRQVVVDGSRPLVVDLAVVPYEPPPYDRNNVAKPYGAPPARTRIV